MELFSEYFKKNHFLSRIDARVKFLVSLAILVMVLSYKGIAFPLFISLICLLLCIWMKIPLKVFLIRFSEPLFIVFIIILLKLFFSGKDILFSIPVPNAHMSFFHLTAYKDGLMDGMMIASRIIGAVSVVAVIGFSTPFTEIITGLSWLRIPRGFVEVLMFAYRYIFVLFEDAMVIYNAQKNRLGYCSIRGGLNSFSILTGSLILKAFENSRNIAISMIQRGYNGNMPAIRYKPFQPLEIFSSILVIVTMGSLWIFL